MLTVLLTAYIHTISIYSTFSLCRHTPHVLCKTTMLTFRFRKCAYSVVCIIYLIWTKPVYTVASITIFVHILNILFCKYKNSIHRFLCPKARNPKQSATASSTRGSCPNPTEECKRKKRWKMNWRLWDVYAHRQASTQHGHNLLIVKLLSPNLTSHSQTPLKHHTLSHPTHTRRSHSTSADHTPHLHLGWSSYVVDLEDHADKLCGQEDLLLLGHQCFYHVLLTHVCNTTIGYYHPSLGHNHTSAIQPWWSRLA